MRRSSLFTLAVLTSVVTSAVALAGCSKGPEDVKGIPSSGTTADVVADSASSLQEDKCGSGALPDCPLQGWMKANTLAAMSAEDFERLGRALTRAADLAPDGFAGWKETALAGVEAASRHDLEGVRASCKGCHDAHRSEYRLRFRTRPIRGR
jgi:hypothetical protein